MTLFSFQPCCGVVADESLRAFHFPHDVVARINASRATDAFHLQPVADVDPGRADLNTACAVDAIPGIRISRFPARLTTHGIVTDDDRFIIRQGGLDASVGAEDDAELLAEPCEAEVEGSGEGCDNGKGGSVLERAFPHELVQARQGDEVADKHMGNGG